MSQKLYHVTLGSSGIVLSLPIVNVKGTDLALFNPRGKTSLNSRCAQLLAARFPQEATVILMAAGKAEGLLARLPGEGPVHFRASIAEHKVLPALIGRFVEGVLGGSAEPLVAYLAGSEKLSAKDLEMLRSICRKIDKDPEKP